MIPDYVLREIEDKKKCFEFCKGCIHFEGQPVSGSWFWCRHYRKQARRVYSNCDFKNKEYEFGIKDGND